MCNEGVHDERKKVLAGGLVLVVLIGLFPPWEYTFNSAFRGVPIASCRPAGYAPIFLPPEPAGQPPLDGVRLDLRRLFVQWALIASITGALIALRKRS